MAKRTKKTVTVKPSLKEYDSVLGEIAVLLESARRTAARSVNSLMTATYWEIGRRIVEFEQGGKQRAEYGAELITQLARDLTERFGRGFSRSNLQNMRLFYEQRPIRQALPSESLDSELGPIRIRQAVPAKSSEAANGPQIPQTPSGESPETASERSGVQIRQAVTGEFKPPKFPLPWTHYVRLLYVQSEFARNFYEQEAIRGGWSSRQLDRQINSQFYERTALSRNKAAMLIKGQQAQPEDLITAEQALKDPYVLEFLDLKDEYSESELEAALIEKLETFLLELGGDFTFVGRQRRLRIDDEWYRIDLLFFHRRLRCLVIIDLKLGKFTHADAGQMHMYLNYARAHWTLEGENPPVGLILCAAKGSTLAKYALEGLPNKVLAAEYRTALPTEQAIADELELTRQRPRRLALDPCPSQPARVE